MVKSKVASAIAAAGLLAWSGAQAGPEFTVPSTADETSSSMTTLTSLDWKTGGFQGWGPMANPETPFSDSENIGGSRYFELKEERAQHLAEVRAAREQTWLANAPLRAEYENIGATRERAGGFGGFFGR